MERAALPDAVVLAVMEAHSPRLQAKFDELKIALDGTGIAVNLISYMENDDYKNPRLP